MKISIVIPVYNEGDRLSACLEAIARQSMPAHQVIVVDNNSTDSSASVAASYDFVTLISEPNQGVIHARTTGFNLASGDIIARIDGDSVLPKDWLENVTHIFRNDNVDAVSGAAYYEDVAAAPIFDGIDLFFRRRLSRQLSGNVFLWGANMAMRRSAWQRVSSGLCVRGGMHEDYDLAIHLQRLGLKVAFDERLTTHVSSRRIEMSYRDFMGYVWVSPNTYVQHGIKSARWHMYPVVLTCAIGYLPAKVLYRGYDKKLGRFSWRQFLMPVVTAARVDPTTNVA
jgi:glycosyltransferase involved in cell wall biosynthesis